MPKIPIIPSLQLAVAIGLDPGKSGGLAALGGVVTVVSSMPATEREIWKWFKDIGKTVSIPKFAVIEKVHAMPGNGVSGMFKFGMNYGFLRACLIAAGIPFDEVTPQTWQKGLGIPPRKRGVESLSDWKNRLKAKAQQLFPRQEVTLATADALLIATYCWRKRVGRL